MYRALNVSEEAGREIDHGMSAHTERNVNLFEDLQCMLSYPEFERIGTRMMTSASWYR